MCTAATYKTRDFYFGRTLDHGCSYGEEITITPRNHPFLFREMKPLKHHYAMIGTAFIAQDYPLYYDAVNEKGLAIAGLNFTGNAYYGLPVQGRDNLAVYELIPWLLGDCANVKECQKKLENVNLTNISINDELPVAQLHWIIADKKEAITLEAVDDGMHIYPNPVGILTNNPAFPLQMFQMNNYMHLSARPPQNLFPAIRSRRVSASFSTSLVQWSSPVGAVNWKAADMKRRFTPPAAMQIVEFTIIQPTETDRLPQWICTGRMWTKQS